MDVLDSKGCKLYIVCPFCQMEHFVGRHMGEGLFMSAAAAVFDFEGAFAWQMHSFIQREHVTEVYIAGEQSCLFIEKALQGTAGVADAGLLCERELASLRVDADTCRSLTVKLLRAQAVRWRRLLAGGTHGVSLHLLLTDKQADAVQLLS